MWPALPRPLVVGGLAFLNLAAAFVGQWLVFYVLGVGRDTDALYASMALPQVVALFLSTPITGVMVPILAGLPPDEERQQVSSALLATLIVAVAVLGLLFASAPLWTSILLPGFTGEAHLLVAKLARVHIIGAVAYAGFGVVWASVLARNKLAEAEAGQVVAAVITSAAVYPVANRWGVEGVAWLFALRSLLRFAAAVPLSSARPTLRLRGANLRVIFARAAPPGMSWLYRSTEPLIDNYLLSMAPAGSVSLFNLAQTLYNAALGILNKSIIVPLSARFGILVKAKDFDELDRLVTKYRRIVLGIAVVGFVFLGLLGHPFLRLLIGHGGVTEDNVRTLWIFVMVLSGMMFGHNAAGIATMAFNALGLTKRSSAVAAGAYTLGIGLKIVGFTAFGVFGLALGTSCYQVLWAIAMGVAIRWTYKTLASASRLHSPT